MTAPDSFPFPHRQQPPVPRRVDVRHGLSALSRAHGTERRDHKRAIRRYLAIPAGVPERTPEKKECGPKKIPCPNLREREPLALTPIEKEDTGLPSKGKKAQRRDARRKAAAARARRRRILTWSAITVGLAGAVGFLLFRPLPEELRDVETFAAAGRGHLTTGEAPPEYETSPATSGDHSPSSARCGIYTTEIPDQVQIHNLEHGTVIVQYRSDLDETELRRLQDYGRTKSGLILVAPRSDLDSPVVVTSWARMLPLESADIDTIEAYYDQFAGTGPEVGIPCPLVVDESL